jgi:hypothetical protein
MEAPKEIPTYVHPSGKVLPVEELAPVVNPLEDSKDEAASASVEASAPEEKEVAPAPEKKKRAKK